MVKWGGGKQHGDFCAHEGGHNVTGALVHFDMAKPGSVIHPTPRGNSLWYELYASGENAIPVATTPGLPYKLRQRIVKELGKKDRHGLGRRDIGRRNPVRSARISRLFWTAVLYACVIAMWIGVWIYAGVQYGR
ncbi:MAG: hypothetical protein VR68_11805 [Peptococcaceae bacterium BRH_c4a]|nr:MAG: hypothetical protein VR68_11805 [Peptococcaceae bacterium BRH_c4a]